MQQEVSRPSTPPPPLEPLTLRLRVRYGECDAQYVVFNARYGDYADLAMNEFLRALFGGLDRLVQAGMDTMVVRLVIDFHAPARFDEVLAIGVQAAAIGNTSFTLTMQIHEAASGRHVATVTGTHVLVDAKTYRKMPIPADMRAKLEQGAPGVLIDQSGAQSARA
jgi:acyl-CoA thioester hydrolase